MARSPRGNRYMLQLRCARGAATLVKARFRSLISGQITDRSFKSGEKFEQPDVERRPHQFLYGQGDEFVFMDQASYDQVSLGSDLLGDARSYLIDGIEVRLLFFNGNPVGVELPQYVEMTVTEVAPGTRGDTASGGVTTDATTDTGLTLRVPLYVKPGLRIKVDTRDGSFGGRAE